MVDTIEAGALLKDDISTLPPVFSDWPLTSAKSFGIHTAASV
jgi:hypothetical protein